MGDMSWIVDLYKTQAQIEMAKAAASTMFNNFEQISKVANKIHKSDPSKSWEDCYAEAKAAFDVAMAEN